MYPGNERQQSNVGSALGQRRRRCPNAEATFCAHVYQSDTATAARVGDMSGTGQVDILINQINQSLLEFHSTREVSSSGSLHHGTSFQAIGVVMSLRQHLKHAWYCTP